nr:aldehyde dehydrogenase family protein [Micromonospora sp. DSM 115978]
MAIQSVNPATGAVLKTFDAFGTDEIEARLARAAAAFTGYRRTSFGQRAAWLRAAADLIDAERRDIAVVMTT